MELVLLCILFLRTVSASVRNIDCDFFVQNCIPCLADGECYCKSESEFTILRCNKRIGERRGCFEIFDAERQDFNCKLQSMSVRNTTNGGIQLLRNFTKAEELLNIQAAHDTVFAPQMNLTNMHVELTEQDRSVATVTLIIVTLVFFAVVIIIGIVISIQCLRRGNGTTEEQNQNLEPPVANTVIESKVDEDDGIYECVSIFQ